MNKVENFNQLVDRAMKEGNYAHMRPVIAKELLHYDILFSLENNGLLDQLTFQGGTSLRLCYDGDRFSEDLDFVGGYDFSSENLIAIKDCLEQYIGNRYSLEIAVKNPKEMQQELSTRNVKVDKWQVSIITEPKRKDLPLQKIKLEVANVPAYSRAPRSLRKNYNFLPDGYDDVVVMTETLDEIMADKLVSLPACNRYVRYRDIWDLRWLKKQGAKINAEYISRKIKDYREEKYLEKLDIMLGKLEEVIRGEGFSGEMSRFLPMNVQDRTFKKEKFIELLIEENRSLLESVREIL